MNKIKEALHIGHEKHAEKQAEKETGHKGEGLDIAHEEGKRAYESGQPTYAGRSGTGGVASTGTTNQDDSFKAAGGMSTDTPAGGAYTGSQHLGQSKHTPGAGVSDAYSGQGEGYATGAEASRYAGNTGANTDTFVNDPTTSSRYDNTIGTTGATGYRDGFASNDPVSSGRSGMTGETLYNDRTGHTHPTTGEHTNDATFRNDPTSAPTTGITTGSVGTGNEHLHSHAHAHQTFTGNRLDPAATESLPTFHEEHMHGSKLEHGRPGESTEHYANEHYDPTQGPDFLGRDVALGGAGVTGAGGLGSSNTVGTTGVAGSGPASGTTGPHSSNLANVVDPRVHPDFNDRSGNTTMGNDHHLGRDAAVIGGAGALGTAAYDKPSATQRYDAGTTGLGSASGYQTGPDHTGSLDKQHFHHGHVTSRAGDARDPTTGSAGTLPHDSLEDHMTKHELKEHEKHQREREQGHEKSGLLGGVFGSHDKTSHHGHSDVSSSDYASQPAGGNFSTGSTSHTMHSGRRAGEDFDPATAGTGGTMGTKGYGGEDRYTSGIGGYNNSSNYDDTRTSSNNALHSSGQVMGAPHNDHFGRNLSKRDPHLYDDNTTSSSGSKLSNFIHGGNSSKRRSGYTTRGPAEESSSYDPASENYGSSSGMGAGLVDRSRADDDMTTGLEGTTAHPGATTSSGVTGGPSYADEGADDLQATEYQRSGLSKMLHRENPTKLHKEPKGGY